MKKLFVIALVVLFAAPAFAVQNAQYGWENGGTVLTIYAADAGYAYNVSAPDPVFELDSSLKCVDNTDGGRATPDYYFCWIVGLLEGDVVDATIWRYDTTPGSSPSGRIWAKYTDVGATDYNNYSGSASGNSDYGPGTGWDQTGYTWTFWSDEGTHDGLMISVRTYSVVGDTVWFDDFEVTFPDYCTIEFPTGGVPVEDASWTSIKALYR